MTEHDKEHAHEKEHEQEKHGFMDTIKDGLSHVSKILVASVIPPIAEGAETIMKNIEGRIVRMEKRIIRKISSLVIIGLGGLFLIFALLFFLMDYLGWSHAVAFFAIGITILVIGLILKILEPVKE